MNYTSVMEITEAQYQQIEHCLPRQRGNVSLSNLQVLNAFLYVAEQGCKWRGLPKRFGNWHTIYTRMNRWSKSGVLDRVFETLQHAENRAREDRGGVVGQHDRQSSPRWHRGVKKTVRRPSASPEADGRPRFIWLPRMRERP
jgi:transposase